MVPIIIKFATSFGSPLTFNPSGEVRYVAVLVASWRVCLVAQSVLFQEEQRRFEQLLIGDEVDHCFLNVVVCRDTMHQHNFVIVRKKQP
jgi:hypothetical protein